MGVRLEPGIRGRTAVNARDDDCGNPALGDLVKDLCAATDMLPCAVTAHEAPVLYVPDIRDLREVVAHGIGECDPFDLFNGAERARSPARKSFASSREILNFREYLRRTASRSCRDRSR